MSYNERYLAGSEGMHVAPSRCVSHLDFACTDSKKKVVRMRRLEMHQVVLS